MMPMNIKEECQNNKMILIAFYKFVKESAEKMNLSLEGPLSKISDCAGIHRTQVYECKKQIEVALEKIELDGPGRPKKSAAFEAVHLEKQGWKLLEKVLRYQLKHPGAVVVHKNGYTTYSDGFIRFILDLHDESARIAAAWGELNGNA